MRRRAMTVLATAGIAALALSGCTAVPTSPGETPEASTAQQDPAPVVTVVNDALSDTGASSDSASAGQDTDANQDAGADATTAEAAETAAATPSPDEAADDAVLIGADEPLTLAVEGGEFAEVRLADADHDTVPVDTGSFGTGTSGDAHSPDSPDSPDSQDSPDSPATGTAMGSDGDAEAADEPLAGGSTNPTPGLVDRDGGDTGASGTEDSDETAGSGSAESTGTEWQSSVDLVTGATYTWEATTVSPDGAEHTATGTVTTPETTAQEELTAKTVITDDETVGVGAPVVVMFNSTIPEEARAAIEARLSVDVTDSDGEPVEVEGSWGWLYDVDGISRVHYRPKEFWPANVDVEVNLPLEGVEYSPRWYGKEDVELSFEVGRDQRVVADASTHRMTIERDGEEIADWPTSLGSAQAPSYNGTHVVMAKHEFYTMTSERWNYETPVSWAVRIHNNGEFIHAAPWSVGVQGSANVSHGCINLSTDRAKEYYDMALYGDPVEITGSSVDLTTEHSDISDWVYSWEDWQELSALD